jgi:hypothetical protein
MSKTSESFFEGLGYCINILICIGVFWWATYLWGSDWNFFKSSDQTEKWISLEKKRGYYTSGLDGKWASFTLGWLEVKGKMRQSLDTKEDYYDFVLKVDSKLTNPKLNGGLENKIVENYQFAFTINFIDEDGFIMETFIPYNGFATLKHEKHENHVEWTSENYPYEDKEVTSMATFRHIISEAVAKRVYRISYVPEIKAVIADKKKKPDVWDEIPPVTDEDKKEVYDLLRKHHQQKRIKQ